MMRLIGLLASRLSQGHRARYDISVIVIALVCSMMVLLVGATLLVAVLFGLGHGIALLFPSAKIIASAGVIRWCLAILTGVIAVFTMIAIIRNIRSGPEA